MPPGYILAMEVDAAVSSAVMCGKPTSWSELSCLSSNGLTFHHMSRLQLDRWPFRLSAPRNRVLMSETNSSVLTSRTNNPLKRIRHDTVIYNLPPDA